MKSRDEVRDTTQGGARIVGVILLGVGFLYLLAPALPFDAPGPWWFPAALFGAGIVFAFPRLTFSHAIIARFDALLDRLGPKEGG